MRPCPSPLYLVREKSRDVIRLTFSTFFFFLSLTLQALVIKNLAHLVEDNIYIYMYSMCDNWQWTTLVFERCLDLASIRSIDRVFKVKPRNGEGATEQQRRKFHTVQQHHHHHSSTHHHRSSSSIIIIIDHHHT